MDNISLMTNLKDVFLAICKKVYVARVGHFAFGPFSREAIGKSENFRASFNQTLEVSRHGFSSVKKSWTWFRRMEPIS